MNKNIRETTILEDNQSVICLAKTASSWKNLASYPGPLKGLGTRLGRTKHIDIKYHFIRDMVEAGRIKLTYCASEDMVADMFTKGLPIKQFEKLQKLTGIAEFELTR
jgi:hypothetical protein